MLKRQATDHILSKHDCFGVSTNKSLLKLSKSMQEERTIDRHCLGKGAEEFM